jgi:hypothetical protein
MGEMRRIRGFTLEELDMEEGGACLACGEITGGPIEPDAREYECDSCGERAVYGSEELLLMGLVT